MFLLIVINQDQSMVMKIIAQDNINMNRTLNNNILIFIVSHSSIDLQQLEKNKMMDLQSIFTHPMVPLLEAPVSIMEVIRNKIMIKLTMKYLIYMQHQVINFQKIKPAETQAISIITRTLH